MSFISKDMNLKNSCIFVLMAITCSFSYYLINFYVKYMPGDIFTNQIVNSLAETAANSTAFLIIRALSIKKGFATCYIACAIACMLVMAAETRGMDWLVPFGIIIAKYSISVAFCFIYSAPPSFFPPEYIGLVMGLNNVFGRTSTIAAPIVAEKNDPIPMLSCIMLCGMALVSCTLL